MATRLDAITTGYFLATAKTALPAVGTAKRNLLTSLAIKFNRDWQTETGVEWNSLARDVSAGPAVVDQDTFVLSEPIHYISKDENNFVFINGGRYRVVPFRQLNKYTGRVVAHIVENNVHSIKFADPFLEGDQMIGQTILVPALIKLPDLTSDASEVLIDQPEWLGERIAAQYAFSYKSLRDMYDDLLDLANDRMNSMKWSNDTGDNTTSTGVDYFASMGNVGTDDNW